MDLTPILGGGDTDDQQLNLAGDILGIDDGNTVNLATVDNQNASEVPFTPTGNTVSNNVQDAIVELQSEIDGITVAGGGNPTDELQTLQLIGDILSLTPPPTPNNTIDLSPYLDNQTAAEVLITDTANNFTATDVEGALAELAGASIVDTDDQTIDNLNFDNATRTLSISLIDDGQADQTVIIPDNQDASEVPLIDTDDNFTALDVEGALAELANNAVVDTDDQTADQVPVAATPTSYTPTSGDVEGHLAGIDDAIGAIAGGEVPDLEQVLGQGSNANGQIITGLPLPANSGDVANKDYVDAQVTGLTAADIDYDNTIVTPGLTADNVQAAIDELAGAGGANTNMAENDLALTATRTHDLNGNNFVLDGTGNVGIGNLPGAPQSKLDVDGQIQARNGFAANSGTAGQPSYGFSAEATMGIYRAGVGQLGFSTGGAEAMRIDATQIVTINQSLELDGTLIDINGDAGTAGQILSSTATGIDWIDAPTGGANPTDNDANDGLSEFSATTGYNLNVDDTTIELVADNLQVKDDGISAAKLNLDVAGDGLNQDASGALELIRGTANDQILKWDGDSWELDTDETGGTNPTDNDANDGLSEFSATTGYNLNVDDTTIELVADNLQVKDDGISAAKLNLDVAGDGLNQDASGALELIRGTANDQILKWDGDSWELDTDETGGTNPTDNDANDGLSEFSATTGYNLNVDDTTIELVADNLQVKDDGISAAKLNLDVAGDGLNQDASGALELIRGTANDQILKWDGDSWELDTDETGGTNPTDNDANDGLSEFSATTGYNLNVDDTTIELVADNLQVKDDGISAAKLNLDVAGDGLNQDASGALELIRGTANDQILKWDGDSWELDTDETGGTNPTDNDANDGLSEFSATTGYNLNVDDTTIELVADNLQVRNNGIGQNQIANDAIVASKILNGEVTLPKIAAGGVTDGYVITANSGGATWMPNVATGDGNDFVTGGSVNTAAQTLNLTGSGAVNATINISGLVTEDELTSASNGLALITDSNPGNIGLNNGSAALTINVNDGDFSDTNEIQTVSSTAPGEIVVAQTGINYSIGIGTIQGTNINPDFGTQEIRGGDIYTNGNLIVPDYVFQKYFMGHSSLKGDYQFKTLEQIEVFVKENNHLPGITSASEAKKQGFWNLGKSNIQNLEKIEELFLHTIEQEKKIKTLKEENQKLVQEMDAMKKDMALIKEMLLNKNQD